MKRSDSQKKMKIAEKKEPEGPSLIKFLVEELFDEPKHQQILPHYAYYVYNFIRVPIELEKVLFFGYWVCLDAFLFLFSSLPIRCVHILFSIPLYILGIRKKKISAYNLFDLFQFSLFLLTICFLFIWDTSRVYHWIRQQQAIKLYILFNILEASFPSTAKSHVLIIISIDF